MAQTSATHVSSVGTLTLTVEFTGGLELLFASQRTHTLTVPATNSITHLPSTIADLIVYILEQVLVDKSRKHLFVLDGTVRPGILVLVNDADWELEGEEDYVLQPGDRIAFVSTLHGG